MITLEHGGGGQKSYELIEEMRRFLNFRGKWLNTNDDAAVYTFGKNKEKLVFTTDAFIVNPIFFAGGDIGKIAVCGTINDLVVMGAQPLGLSLSLVIEEGFSKKDLFKIIKSINQISRKNKIPIVTGDTKVIDKGKLDKIEITTAGVGLAKRIINNAGAQIGDDIITSGDLGEHGLALLAYRFNYKTKIKSDCQSFLKEFKVVSRFINAAKDPTRGGLAANINEIADKSKVKIVLDEKNLPYKKEVVVLADLLGIDIFHLPAEGRFIAAVSSNNTKRVLNRLKKFNSQAKIIGKVEKGRGVYLRTRFGVLRKIEMPLGRLIPRIC